MPTSKNVLIASIASLAVAPSFAQETGQQSSGANNVLEEITVTARRRDETLQEIPVQIAVVTGEQLAQFGTTDFTDLQNRVAGLNLNLGGASGGGGSIGLRGISTSSTQAGFEQSVSVIVDGVQVSRARVMQVAMFDVAQVDVIKGPQALFFGKNSPAGAIMLRTEDPGNELNGYLTSSYEFEADEIKVLGAIGGPISDTLGFRLAGLYRDMDGWMENQYTTPLTAEQYPFPDPAIPQPGQRLAGASELALRGTLAFAPSDFFDATLKVTYGDYEDDGPNRESEVSRCGTTDPVHVVRGAPNPYGDCNLDGRNSRSRMGDEIIFEWPDARGEHYTENDQLLTSLDMNFALGDNLTLSSLTGYYESESRLQDNFDHSPFNQLAATEVNDYDSLTQEFRLTSNYDGAFNFVVGAFYQDSSLYNESSTKIFAFGPDPATGRYFSYTRPSTTDTDAISVFGQVIFDITDNLELAAGARYTEEDRDSTMQHTYVHAVLNTPIPALAFLPVGTVLENNQTINDTSPEVTLTWRPSDTISVYGSYKEAYKSGGMGLSSIVNGYLPVDGNGNPLTGQALDDYTQAYADGFGFEPEFIEGYEFGVKTMWLDNRLTLNVAAFTYDYTDLQVSQFDSESLSFRINNAASASVDGLEIDVNWAASEGINVWGSLNYLDATFNDYAAECYDLQTPEMGCIVDPETGVGLYQRQGQNLARAPEIAVVAGFDTFHQISRDLGLGFSMNASYSDDYEAANIGNPLQIQESFWKIDAGVRLVFNDRYRVSMYGRNLTDELITSRVTDSPGAALSTDTSRVVRGRQYVLEVGYDF